MAFSYYLRDQNQGARNGDGFAQAPHHRHSVLFHPDFNRRPRNLTEFC